MGRPKGRVITKQEKGSEDAQSIQSEIDALSQKIQEKGNIKEVDEKIAVFACPRCGETSKMAFYPAYNKTNKASKKTIYCKKCINEMYTEALGIFKNDKKAIVNRPGKAGIMTIKGKLKDEYKDEIRNLFTNINESLGK